jgi:hypothetical protein
MTNAELERPAAEELGGLVILFAVYALLAGDHRHDARIQQRPCRARRRLSPAVRRRRGRRPCMARHHGTRVDRVVAAWALITGIVEVALTFRQGASAGERATWVLGGLVSIALALVLFIRPDIGTLSLATVFGLFAIVYGLSTVVLSVQARKISGSVHRLVDSAA